jgi:hypothetical protein
LAVLFFPNNFAAVRKTLTSNRHNLFAQKLIQQLQQDDYKILHLPNYNTKKERRNKMKKTRIALALLLCGAWTTTAFADADWAGKAVKAIHPAVTTTADLTSGYYIMRNAGHGTYVNGSKDALRLQENLSVNDPNICQLRMTFCGTRGSQYVVYVDRQDDGNYTLRFSTGKYLPRITTGGLTASEEAATLAIHKYEKTDNAFYLHNAGETAGEGFAFLDGYGHNATIGGTLAGWNAGFDKDITDIAACNSAYQFFPVEVADRCDAIDTDKYYMIASARSNSNYSINDTVWVTTDHIPAKKDGTINANTNRVMQLTTSDGSTFVPLLWKFSGYGKATVDGKELATYLITNANSDTPLGQTTGGNVELLGTGVATIWAGHYVIEQAADIASTDVSSAVWLLNEMHDSNQRYIAPVCTKEKTTFNGGDGANITDKAYHWDLIAVEEFPLTLRAGARWATACYPFAITLPEGLTAYRITGELTDGTGLAIEAINGTDIAAKTPMILTDDTDDDAERTYIVSISTSKDTYSANDGNWLVGTTSSRSDNYAAYDNYLLQTDGLFHPNAATLTTIPANRAIIPGNKLTTTQSANTLRLDMAINGGTTGIDALPAAHTADAAPSAVYYDLQGRRVLYPSAGIFVDTNGRKVLLK